MEPRHDEMEKIFSSLSICFQNQIISRERLLEAFSRFLASTMEKEEHHPGIVLHTGSLCFDAVLLAQAALANILYNTRQTGDILAGLQEGDMVIYNKERYVYEGREERREPIPGNYILLSQRKKMSGHATRGINRVPERFWHKIRPYNGTSTTTDGRGLHKRHPNYYSFFASVFSLEENQIPRLLDKSTVVIMPRKEADALVAGLSFLFPAPGNAAVQKEIPFLDVFSAAYYTDTQEYSYKGNAGRADPVIKITGTPSRARSLLLSRDKSLNKTAGLLVLGERSCLRSPSELAELIGRKKGRYVYLSLPAASAAAAPLVKQYEDASLFACTKDFLLSYSTVEPAVKNPLTRELFAQADTIIDKEVLPVPVPGGMEWSVYKEFLQSMDAIRAADFNENVKSPFILRAFSLMNLLTTAVFPLRQLDRLIGEQRIQNVETSEERAARLEEGAEAFPDFLKEKAQKVIAILEDLLLRFYDASPKEEALRRILREHAMEKITIVVPKAYYTVPVREMIRRDFSPYTATMKTVSANQFDGARASSYLIAAGCKLPDKKFDVFRCSTARRIDVLLYDAERVLYDHKLRRARKEAHLLNLRQTLPTEDEYEDIPPKNAEDIADMEQTLARYIEEERSRTLLHSLSRADYTGETGITAAAQFDTDERAFFTRNYKAYVLDDGGIIEKSTGELTEGDVVIFTRSTAASRDIVDATLQYLSGQGRLPEKMNKTYLLSRAWKNALCAYRETTHFSVSAIARQMKENGVAVDTQTIRSWLNEDAHTVIPRSPDSIRQIALLTRNDELFTGADACFRAGKKVYRLRRFIQNAIGQAILRQITGQEDNAPRILRLPPEQIREMAVPRQIVTLLPLENKKAPLNLVNRPLPIPD